MATRGEQALVDRIERYLIMSMAIPDLPLDAPLGFTIHWDHREDRRFLRRVRPISQDLLAMGQSLRKQQDFLLAVFRRGGKKRAGAKVRLPVFMPEARGEAAGLLGALERSGVEVVSATQGDFIHQAAARAAEFATVADQGRTGVTTVHTPRDAETVVFCKGYFLSTTEGFGLSTPARKAIAPGQYCFGVLRDGTPRFQDLLWDCPTNLHLDLT